MGKQDSTEPVITEFNPEPLGQPITTADQQREAHFAKLREFAASCSRERQRISYEHAVRLGDSLIHEAGLAKAISEVLERYEEKYLKISNP